MSRHHRAQQWSKHSPKLRAKILPLLPLPCIECGRPVLKTDTWHVGHRLAAMLPGSTPKPSNVGPAHAKCNLKSGGAMGAKVTNAQRAARRDIREW